MVRIPAELEKLLVVVEHELPAREQLHEIAAASAPKRRAPQGAELETLLDAGRADADGGRAPSACRWCGMAASPPTPSGS